MKGKKKASPQKKMLIALVSVLAVVFTLLLAATVYVEWVLGRFYYDPSQDGPMSLQDAQALLQDDQGNTIDPNLETVNPDDIQLGQVGKVNVSEHVLNILLVGQDRREGEKERTRSDTMILVTINMKDKQVTLTSFMRDLYVKIPGYYNNRLNVAYRLGGAELLFDTLEYNFGIRPDHFVEVDFSGFRKVVDMVGGIDMELTKKEANHLNNNEFGYDFPEEDWHLKEGMNHLNGKQALAYARIRKIDATGDFARTDRQRRVVTSLIEKTKTMNVLEINSLVLTVSDIISTDMTANEIMGYVAELAPLLEDMNEVESIQIPADGKYKMTGVEGVGSVLVPDLPGNSKVIAEYQK